MQRNELRDVIIIGGGWSGISAAMELQRRDPRLDVLVLEAGPRLGGRSRTITRSVGAQRNVDLGAHYFGKMHERLSRIIGRYAHDEVYDRVPVYGDDPGFRAFLGGRWVITTRTRSFFQLQGLSKDVPWADGLRVARSALLAMAIEQLIDRAAPWETPLARMLDAFTLSDFIEAQDLTPAVRDMWDLASIGINSADSKHISLLYFFWYHATSGGFMVTANDWEGSPQQFSVRCGLGGVLERYAEDFTGEVRCNAPVTLIRSAHDHVSVATRDAAEPFRARRVIVAASPHAVGTRIEFEPALSPERRCLHAQRMGHAAKLIVFYDEAWWTNSHDVHFYGYFGGVRSDGLEWALDTSDPTLDEHSLMFFVSPTLAVALDRASAQEARELVRAALIEITGDARAATFTDHVFHRWASDAYVGGGPNTTFAPSVLTTIGRRFLAPEGPAGRLRFAAAELSTEFSGYVEGAIRSGEATAREVHADIAAERGASLPPSSRPPFPIPDPRRLRPLRAAACLVGSALLTPAIRVLDLVR